MAARDDIDLDSLLRERSLFQIYRSAPSFFSNSFNSSVLAVSLAISISFTAIHYFNGGVRDAVQIPFATTYASWANAGVSFAATILGFLIAGFTVLCTILRPPTMIALHRIVDPRYNQSRLKLLFSDFVQVTVYYLCLLLVSIVVLVFGGQSGPAAMLGKYLAIIDWRIPFAALHVIFVAWTALFIVAVLQLKSFVYNIYSSLILGLADAADDHIRMEAKKRLEASERPNPESGSV